VTTDKCHLVWIAAASWDGIPGADWPMARAMTRYARVLWVDPPISAATPARRRGDIGGGIGGILPSLSAVEPDITRLTPVALPGLTRPGIHATTAPLLRAQIRWALRRLRIRPAVVVAGNFEDVLGRWNGAVNVLYISDDYIAGAGLMRVSASRLRAQERKAAARADVVAVVSPLLAEHWSGIGADPVLIRNGCSPVDVAPSPAAPGLPRPVTGVVGQFTGRINLRLLEAVAADGFSLLLVGPHDTRWEPQRFAALTARPNVRHVGRVPIDEVPSYLAAMDVGLTPYADTPFNQASFPLKTLEYLGAGLPVVSTDLSSSRWLRDDLASSEPAAVSQLIALAGDEAGFVSAVRRLASEPGAPGAAVPARARAGSQKTGRATAGRATAADANAARAASARAFAARHTWERRAEVLAAAIGLRAPQPTAHDQVQARG
jgi:teichuronic acid biosynthesis glycosyltransferase TuaH